MDPPFFELFSEAAEGESAGRWRPRTDGLVDAGAAVYVLRTEERPDRVRGVDRPSTFGQLLVSKAGRWIIASFGLVVVGYLLFDNSFVGTFDEIAGIFFWAFGLDVTVDLFWEQGKKLIPSKRA